MKILNAGAPPAVYSNMPPSKTTKKHAKTAPDAWFTSQLMEWHATHNRREMPWKGEKDPYRIWLSEIILQQTRVEQGWAYYLRFTEAYPTVQQLAAAPDESVFKLWEGLGYYSRCRNLLAAARQIVAQHGGIFPADYQQIINLKGVGPYTAAAIASFAFGLPHAVVDGNVIRVLARFFGIDTAFDSTEGKKQFARKAQQLLHLPAPGAYNQAMMDFGATVCTPQKPQCGQCPLATHCEARLHSLTSSLPVKGKKLLRRDRLLLYTVVKSEAGLLVRRRQQRDVWQDLYELVLIEPEDGQVPPLAEWQATLRAQLAMPGLVLTSLHGPLKQELTHQTIRAMLAHGLVAKQPAPAGYEWADEERLRQLAFPRLLARYLQQTNGAQASIF
ncbi:MAG: A/G-specific adenine glycosylase [Chitinophagaceae bacterium]|jgi:A/G-specific adenine glycosylase|nr:A/G-specific adenine glycosylase [Chitinophagaceae bacterium]